MPPLRTPLASSKFTLNTAGVAGFFGGEEAISAMHTVHLYKGRRWLGWFNSPGSYTIAKCFGKMANSRFWDGLFPGSNDSPAVSFGLDGKKGPQYIAALSGTRLSTTQHLAYLVMEQSKEEEPEKIDWRVTTPVDVAYLAMKPVDYGAPVKPLPLKNALLGLIPIIVSVVTCVMCALVYDWFGFSMILVGIVSSGWASVVIGRGRLVIESVKEPAPGAPSGHGILMGEDGVVVVIKGTERDVNAITKGRFVLKTGSKQVDVKEKQGEGNKQGDEGANRDDKGNRPHDEGNEQVDAENPHHSEEKGQSNEIKKQGDEGKKQETEVKKQADEMHPYHEIGICSLVLLVQFLLQLLLVPQGTLFGQIMFLISLGVSWGYNSYLSSLEKEKIQARILFQTLGDPKMRRFRAGTRTTMTVFVCLLLFHRVEGLSPEKNRELRIRALNECIPNDTDVWRRWKGKVVQQLLNIDGEGCETLPHLSENGEDQTLSKSDKKLLGVLLGDARAAFTKYFRVRQGLPDDSSHQNVVES